MKKSNNHNGFSAVFSAYTTLYQDEWFIDSGSTMHMTRYLEWMYDLRPPPIKKIMVANSDSVSVQSMGNINIQTNLCKKNCPIQIINVLFIPELSTNLLSISQLTKNGCKVEFTDMGCNIYNTNKVLIATAQLPITCTNSILLKAVLMLFHVKVGQILLHGTREWHT